MAMLFGNSKCFYGGDPSSPDAPDSMLNVVKMIYFDKNDDNMAVGTLLRIITNIFGYLSVDFNARDEVRVICCPRL